MERLLSNYDWHTAVLTATVILACVLTYHAVAFVVRRVHSFFRNLRFLTIAINTLDRDVKVLKGAVRGLEIREAREERDIASMSIPPPLPLSCPTIDATDWCDDDKKTEIRPEPCLPVENR
jgi:hypothetical protein